MFSSHAYIRKNLETCLSYVTASEELALHNTLPCSCLCQCEWLEYEWGSTSVNGQAQGKHSHLAQGSFRRRPLFT